MKEEQNFSKKMVVLAMVGFAVLVGISSCDHDPGGGGDSTLDGNWIGVTGAGEEIRGVASGGTMTSYYNGTALVRGVYSPDAKSPISLEVTELNMSILTDGDTENWESWEDAGSIFQEYFRGIQQYYVIAIENNSFSFMGVTLYKQ
jgi:hypothetical protein